MSRGANSVIRGCSFGISSLLLYFCGKFFVLDVDLVTSLTSNNFMIYF